MARIQDPKVQLLAETDDATVPVPVAAKPIPVQAPPVAAPVEVRNAAAAAPTPPDRSGEDEVEASPTLGNLTGTSEHPLGVALTSQVAELLGSGKHDLAVHVRFAVTEELGELQDGRADQRCIFQKRPAVLALVVDEIGRERKNYLVHCSAFLLLVFEGNRTYFGRPKELDRKHTIADC